MHSTYKEMLDDEAATLLFGARMAKCLPENLIVNLYGNLGAGKTTLVRGVLRKLGFKQAVKSPTYTLVEPYCVDEKCVYHFDLYRLEHPEALEFIGMRDYAHSGVCFVEWAEKGEGYLPVADIDCCLKTRGKGREIILHANTKKGCAFLKHFGE